MDARAHPDAPAKGRVFDCLPPSYRASLDAEASAHLAAIRTLLLTGIQLRDARSISRALRELHQFLELKYEFPRPERAFLAQQCLAAIPLSGYDITLQSKFIRAATSLLAKKKLDLVVPWEPLYNLLESLVETSRSAPYNGASGPATRIRSLASLVKAARRYFPAGSAAAIWSKCEPLFCPYDNSCLLGQAMLCTFTPLEDLASQQQLLDRVMKLWPWIDRSSIWDSGWLTLVARLAKRSGVSLNFDAHIPMLFTVALRLLDITLGNSALPHPAARTSPVEVGLLMGAEPRKIGKLIANLLSPQRKTQEYLDQFMRSIASYYHPSNGGAWSGKLAALTLGLVKSFAMRVAREKEGATSAHHLGDVERRAFVATLLSVLHTAQYSKNSELVYSAEQALKHLAYIVPDMVLPFQVERAYNSLTNVTATHATLSAFETLANIVHPLLQRNNYPAGAASLLDLMFATLPGIDPNDATKTNAAFKFYFALLNCMPLSDVSRSPASAENDFDQRAKDATAQFEDFSLQLLERIFSFLAQKSAPEKKPAYAARLAASLLPRLFTSLFGQMSSALHAVALKKLRSYINENILPNAQKEFGFLIEAASLGQPAPTIAAFVPSLCSAILHSDTELASASDEETVWRLHMLAAAVKRTGPLLLPHVARLRPVIRLAVYDQRKGVQKEGTKLLRAVLFSLSHTYPTDYRAWDPALQKASGEKDPWLHWGRRYTWKDTDVQWHIPTSEEVKVSAALVAEMSEKALARLTELAAQPTTNIPRPELYTYIGVLSGIVRSAALLLPEDATDVIARHDLDKESDTQDDADTDNRPFNLPIALDTPVTAFAAEVTVLANWRERLHRMCHTLVGVFSEHRKEDIRGTGLLIKLIGRALYTRGARPSRVDVRLKFNKTMLDKHRAWTPKPIRHFRYDLVSGAYLRHLQRVTKRGDFVPFTKTVKALIHDLANLSLSQYSEVRQTAQSRLQAAVKHFPMSTVPLVKDFIRILPQSGIPDEKITGAAYSLMIKTLMRRVWRDWRLLSDFVLALCQTHVHSKVTHQSRLFQLFAIFASGFFQLPLALPEPDPKGPASAAALEQARQWRQRASERNEATWLATVNGLLAVVQNPQLHWRYSLVASCSLYFLVRDDRPAPTGVYTWFTKCLTAELPPMRTLGMKALYVLLRPHKPRSAKSEATVAPAGTNVYEWLNSGPFHDKNYLGWNGPLVSATVTRSPSPTAAPAELFAQLSSPATAEAIVKLMALDHRVKDENVSGPSEISRVIAGVAFMLGAQSGLDSKDVADELIRRLVKADFRTWPKVATPRHSTQFQVLNARLFHRLYQVYGARTLDAFEAHIAAHFAAAEEGEQCAVAEFVCGVLRGLLVQEEATADTQRVRTFVVKAMQEAVLSRQLTIEMITMWGTGLRFAVYNLDRRRYQWLLDLFFKGALEEVQSAFALNAAKRLYFMRSFLLELTWRGADIAKDMLVSLTPMLAHPYKQARLEIAQLFYFSLVALAFPPAGSPVPPVAGETLKALVAKAQAHADSGADLAEEGTKARSAWRDSVSLFLQSLFRNFSGASHPHFADCVAILLHCQNDVDTDVSKTAKSALALAGQAIAKPQELRELDAVLSLFSRSASWHVRQALLPFLQLLAFDHQFLLADLAAMREFAVGALTDAHVEVRELASHSLSSLLRVVTAAEAKQLTTRFAKLAATPLAKSKGQLTAEESAARITRHAGVLGLIGLVHTQPYELPDWMVDTLLLLARHANDPSPINTSVRRAFGEFFRTHQDMWHVHKEKFSRDDLYTINQLILSPSYYA